MASIVGTELNHGTYELGLASCVDRYEGKDPEPAVNSFSMQIYIANEISQEACLGGTRLDCGDWTPRNIKSCLHNN